MLSELGRLPSDDPRKASLRGYGVCAPVGGTAHSSSTCSSGRVRKRGHWGSGFHATVVESSCNGSTTTACETFWILSQGGQKRGWQHEAAGRMDQQFRDEDLFHRVAESVRALIRSQGGRMAGMALSTSPTSQGCHDLVPQTSSTSAPSPSATAGVADHLIPVATTVQLVLRRGCCGEERFCGRARQPASVEKKVAGSGSMCSCETWTSSCPMSMTAKCWRSWSTACHCSEDANEPSTRPLLELSAPTAQLAQEQQTGMERHWWLRDDAKKPLTRSWLAPQPMSSRGAGR